MTMIMMMMTTVTVMMIMTMMMMEEEERVAGLEEEYPYETQFANPSCNEQKHNEAVIVQWHFPEHPSSKSCNL